MNFLPRTDRVLMLKLICRNNGISDIADIIGCSTTTARSQLARMGEACAALHDAMVRGARPTRLELDELWSYNYCKRDRNLRKRDSNPHLGARVRQPPVDRGQQYTWIAFDPDSKMVLSYFTGDRGTDAAVAFLNDLNFRVDSKPLISTDAHIPYPDALDRTFGANMDHVVMEKEFRSWFNPETRESGNVLIGLQKIAQNQSLADLTGASTSHVERMNLNVRHFISRFNRSTIRFSKKLDNHKHNLAIMFMYYNFVRSHYGFLKTECKHFSPAMKAGIANKLWSYDDLLDEIDGFWRARDDKYPKSVPNVPQYMKIAPTFWTELPYLVSHSQQKLASKVHAAHCRDCKRAAGGRKEGARANDWYGFATRDEALKCAEMLAPMNHSVCSICILGRYPGGLATGRGRRKN